MANTNPGNFANRTITFIGSPKEEVLAAASKGGKASSTATESAPDDSGTGKQGFASMDPERVREIASMGGKAAAASRAEGSPDEDETGKQGFASMDPERQREIASMGGKASSGSFKPGEWRAKEAGHKGGLASHGGGSS
ncbi:hypothetical protein RB598_002041 [Gaeumannomyces tritici]